MNQYRNAGSERITLGLRATAVPITNVYIDSLEDCITYIASSKPLEVISQGEAIKLSGLISEGDTVPLLRGKRVTSDRRREEDRIYERDIYRNGKIDYRFAIRRDRNPISRVYSRWVLRLCANCMIAVERFRQSSGQPGVEYALQVEIRTIGSDATVVDHSDEVRYYHQYHLGGLVRLPVLSMTSVSSFPDVLALIKEDFFNAAGMDWSRSLRADFAEWI